MKPSAVWVVTQLDDLDGYSCVLPPAYATKDACLTRVIRLRERETEPYSYRYRRIPLVGLPSPDNSP